jgi:hypothetical protein
MGLNPRLCNQSAWHQILTHSTLALGLGSQFPYL